MTRITALLVAILVVLLPTASPVQAASCTGKSHQTTLSEGRVSPGSATLGTTMTFSVVYADTAGCIPSVVSVTVQGVGTFTMSTGGTDLVAGVTYSWAASLPIGSYGYSFSATSGKGNGQATVTLTAVTPGRATVTAPPPPPTPAPTAPPTPRPTTPPPPPPAATPRPTAPAPAPATPGPPAPAAPVAPTQAPSSEAPEPAAPSDAPSASPSPTSPEPASEEPAPASPEPTATPSSSTDAGPLLPPLAGATDGGSDKEGSGPPALLGLAAVLAASGIGLGLWFLAGRRRQGDQAADRTAGATVDLVSTAGDEAPVVSKLPPMRDLVPPVNVVLLEEEDAHVPPPPSEAELPRWLRPSLRQARYSGSRDHHWDD